METVRSEFVVYRQWWWWWWCYSQWFEQRNELTNLWLRSGSDCEQTENCAGGVCFLTKQIGQILVGQLSSICDDMHVRPNEANPGHACISMWNARLQIDACRWCQYANRLVVLNNWYHTNWLINGNVNEHQFNKFINIPLDIPHSSHRLSCLLCGFIIRVEYNTNIEMETV